MYAPKSERERFLSQPEFEKLLLAADDLGDDYAFMLVYAGGALGLRIGEAVALSRDNFKRLRENLVSVATLKRRGHPVEDVALDDESRELFQEYLTALRGRWLFPSTDSQRRGGHISLRQANRLFKRVVLAAGLNPKFSYHALRHYRGLRLWQSTRDMKFVQLQLRHASMRHTPRYVHMDEKSRVAVARKVGPIRRR
jgi:integrase